MLTTGARFTISRIVRSSNNADMSSKNHFCVNHKHAHDQNKTTTTSTDPPSQTNTSAAAAASSTAVVPTSQTNNTSSMVATEILLPATEDNILILTCKPPQGPPPTRNQSNKPTPALTNASNNNSADSTWCPIYVCSSKTSSPTTTVVSSKSPPSMLVSPSSLKQSLLTKQEVEDRVKFSILSSDQFQKCQIVNAKDVLTIGGNDVTCVGCRKGIETLLETLKHTQLACFNKVEFVNGAKIKVNSGGLTNDSLYHNLAVSKYRVKEIFDSLPRKNKTRCLYHSVNYENGGFKDASLQWNILWENTTPEFREDVVRISFRELKNNFEVYVKKHRFCDDCQEHLIKAFRILFEPESSSNYDDVNPELYACFQIEKCQRSGEKYVRVTGDMRVEREVNELLNTHFDSNGSNEERHARSLDVAQKEIVVCVAMLLHKRAQSIVMKFSSFITCVEMLPHMIWLTFRNNLETAVEDIEGQIRIEKTLKEIALVDARLEAQKERKREKKRNRKNKLKKMNQEQLNANEDDESPTSIPQNETTTLKTTLSLDSLTSCDTFQNPATTFVENKLTCNSATNSNSKKRGANAISRNASATRKNRRNSPSPVANLSDGGYSTGADSRSPRGFKSGDAWVEKNEAKGGNNKCGSKDSSNSSSSSRRRQLSKSNNSSSSGISVISPQSTSPVSTDSCSNRRSPTTQTTPDGTKVNIDHNNNKGTDSKERKTKKPHPYNANSTCQDQLNDRSSSNNKIKNEGEQNKNNSATSKKTVLQNYKSFWNNNGANCSNGIDNNICPTVLSSPTQRPSNKTKNSQKTKQEVTTKSGVDIIVGGGGGAKDTFLTADEINEFKTQHSDYLKMRDIMREKIKTNFEHRLIASGLKK